MEQPLGLASSWIFRVRALESAYFVACVHIAFQRLLVASIWEIGSVSHATVKMAELTSSVRLTLKERAESASPLVTRPDRKSVV